MLQSALSRYRLGETTQILLDKFAPRTTANANPMEPRASGTKDRFFELNKAVLEELGRLDRSGPSRIVIVGHRDVPRSYLPLMDEAGLKFIDLRPELDELARSGTDPYYWPVTHSRGHWNQEGQEFVGEYLARRLSEIEHLTPAP